MPEDVEDQLPLPFDLTNVDPVDHPWPVQVGLFDALPGTCVPDCDLEGCRGYHFAANGSKVSHAWPELKRN